MDLGGDCRQRPERAGLRERIEEIAELKRRYGYRRVYLKLRREESTVNRKHIYRIYRDAGQRAYAGRC